MKVIASDIPDVKIIEPDVFGDSRGYFFESWNSARYADAGITGNWVQDNESCSSYGVLRGLHYQAVPYTQAKLVRVISGCVLDVAVDIRRGSSTFGKYVAVELSGENKRQLYVPRGFAHKCDNIYMPSSERGIAYNDPELQINWQIDLAQAKLSGKDLKNPVLSQAELFDFNHPEYLQ